MEPFDSSGQTLSLLLRGSTKAGYKKILKAPLRMPANPIPIAEN
jgi:hypothetical protein